MNTFVILPDQLFTDISVLEFLKDFDRIIVVEEPAYFRAATEEKIALMRACMKCYYDYLGEQMLRMSKCGVSGKKKTISTEQAQILSKASLLKMEQSSLPKLNYVDAAKILPRGDLFEYLTGMRTQIHMFRIAACYTWGSKPWDYTYYGLPIKFHESPGFLVPYCEIKYGDIFIAGSTRMNKGNIEPSSVSFGEFVHRFFKIAVDNSENTDSTRYDPAVSKVVTALPAAFSSYFAIAGFKKSHNAINADEFSYKPSACIKPADNTLTKTQQKVQKTSNYRTAAKKYAKDIFDIINKNNTAEQMQTTSQQVQKVHKPRKVGSNPEIITRVNSHDLLLQQKAMTLPDVKLNRANSVMVGINKMHTNALHKTNALHQTKISKLEKISKVEKASKPAAESQNKTLFSAKNEVLLSKTPFLTTNQQKINCKNYPVSVLEANKLSIAFMNKFVRDYATYPSGAILELMFPLNMGLITPQMLLTHVLSVYGPQCKQNILLFLRDLLYREYLRCVYITDSQFINETYTGINFSQSLSALCHVSIENPNNLLTEVSIEKLSTLKKNITSQKFMAFASANLPWYFYWCGFLQI